MDEDKVDVFVDICFNFWCLLDLVFSCCFCLVFLLLGDIDFCLFNLGLDGFWCCGCKFMKVKCDGLFWFWGRFWICFLEVFIIVGVVLVFIFIDGVKKFWGWG